MDLVVPKHSVWYYLDTGLFISILLASYLSAFR